MSEVDTQRRDALVTRLMESATGMMEVCCIYLGDRLGLPIAHDMFRFYRLRP